MTAPMQGFPVVPEQRIPRQSWDRAPWNRWAFQHMREILPTAEVWRGSDPVWQLPERIESIDNIQFTDHAGSAATVGQWLTTSFTDGFIFLSDGVVKCERYLNGMDRRTLHLSQSVAKSIVASVAGIMIGRGLLDPAQAVTHYLPELVHTAWRGATLRHLLDMSSGVKYNEDYLSPESDVSFTDYASGWKLPPPGIRSHECVWDQITTLGERAWEHGARFEYRSIETDVLAHCMERVAQTRLPELISVELWRKLGCEESACFTVDAAGYALASGGFNACLRDYARFGQMLLNHGQAGERAIVPSLWIDDTTAACVHSLFGSPYTEGLPFGAYRNQFWIEDYREAAFMARGVFGQLIYINPATRTAAVKLSSWPEVQSIPRLRDSLNAIHALSEHFSRSRQGGGPPADA